jgi:outer membrane protein TolC
MAPRADPVYHPPRGDPLVRSRRLSVGFFTPWSENAMKRLRRSLSIWTLAPAAAAVLFAAGCTSWLVRQTDRDVARLIEQRQRETLHTTTSVQLPVDPALTDADKSAYEYAPSPVPPGVPAAFEIGQAGIEEPPAGPAEFESEGIETQPRDTEPAVESRTTDIEPLPQGVDNPQEPATQPGSPEQTAPESQSPEGDQGAQIHDIPQFNPDDVVTSFRQEVFTLADSLAYMQLHRREFQNAKEDLYIVALALTLERHLWTPVYSADLRTIYGNYGQIRDFDQAMRFVSELGVSQRLPYGGEFTAQMISTLIRDVGKSITASEGSQAVVGLNIPFLRNAGHIAREELIQLERSLTYAVRTFERFRREQLVLVMGNYFDLLATKQAVIDSAVSYVAFISDFERAQAMQVVELGTVIDTGRAELAMLQAEQSLAVNRERFRAQTDRFKLLIGMPVDEPIGLGDLESIEELEAQIEADLLPLLRRPQAVENEALAIAVAEARRLDLLNTNDRIDDARRGVKNAKNQLLPDLDLASSVAFDTDPDHFRLGGFNIERSTWRSELLLSLPVERTAERNAYRRSIIDAHRAQRAFQEALDSVRAEVRSALNEILLAELRIQIQRRAVDVAARRREFALIQLEEGNISNRDKVEAENELNDARNQLNLAKTSRWSAILDYRLTTGTLLIDESGRQEPPPGP